MMSGVTTKTADAHTNNTMKNKFQLRRQNWADLVRQINRYRSTAIAVSFRICTFTTRTIRSRVCNHLNAKIRHKRNMEAKKFINFIDSFSLQGTLPNRQYPLSLLSAAKGSEAMRNTFAMAKLNQGSTDADDARNTSVRSASRL